MTARWFIGGPLAGWHDAYRDSSHLRYPLPRPASWAFEVAEGPPAEAFRSIGTYTRRRVRLPGWLVVLTVYTCDEDEDWSGANPRIPIGAEFPGVIWGARLDMCGTGAWRLDAARRVWRLRSGLVRAEVAREVVQRNPEAADYVAGVNGVALPPEAYE